MLKSSPNKGSNVGGMKVPTTLDNDHHVQEDRYTEFEGHKKDGTEENNLVVQVNQVRYIDNSGKVTQSEEAPQHCLEGKDQDKASASLNILENQADEVSSVSESMIAAVEVVPDMEKYEICESQNNLGEPTFVTKPYDEQEDREPYDEQEDREPYDEQEDREPYDEQEDREPFDEQEDREPFDEQEDREPFDEQEDREPYDEQEYRGPSEPYQGRATKSQSAKTMAKIVYGKSTTDTNEKNIPMENHDMSDQYVGADDLAAGGSLEHEEFMTFGTRELTGKEKTFAMPNKKMKKDEGSIGGINKHGPEKITEENSTSRVSSGQPNRCFKKTPSTYDNLKEKNKPATAELQMTNNKADKEAGKLKKHPNQNGRTEFGWKWLAYLVVAIHLLSKIPMVQGLDGEWRVYWFCVEEGLSGKNLSMLIGSRNICELTGVRSPCNLTCDEESEVFWVSEICRALITRCANNGLFLEQGGDSTPPSSSETFRDRENAIKNVLSKVTPNPNTTGTPIPNSIGTMNPNSTGTPNPSDITNGTNSAWHIWDNYAVTIILPVANLIVLLFGIKQWNFLCRCIKKCRSSEISSTEEGMELNTVKVTDGTPNGINGHAAHNGISSSVVVVK